MQTKNQAGAAETDGRGSRTPKPSRRFYKATAGGEGKVCLEGPAQPQFGSRREPGDLRADDVRAGQGATSAPSQSHDFSQLTARQDAGARVSSSRLERLSATLARRPLVVGQPGVARGVAGRPLVVGRRTLAASSGPFAADSCP